MLVRYAIYSLCVRWIMRISSADFLRQFGRRCDEALTEPVIITRNGRDRLILMSLATYRTFANAPDVAKPDNRKQSGKAQRRLRKGRV